jgi:hypothetical protein
MIQHTKNKKIYQSRDPGCSVTEIYRCPGWQMVVTIFMVPPGGFRDSGFACVLLENVRARGEMVLKTLCDLPAEFEYERLN